MCVIFHFGVTEQTSHVREPWFRQKAFFCSNQEGQSWNPTSQAELIMPQRISTIHCMRLRSSVSSCKALSTFCLLDRGLSTKKEWQQWNPRRWQFYFRENQMANQNKMMFNPPSNYIHVNQNKMSLGSRPSNSLDKIKCWQEDGSGHTHTLVGM